MALATTCPHCKTSFKVVADQLKLRRGLVRCGKCQEVFSGVDYLRYIDEVKPRGRTSEQVQELKATRSFNKPGTEASANPAPAQDALEDLRTAFFLPETVFEQSRHVDGMTIQAPVPAYLPTPKDLSNHLANPEPVSAASPAPSTAKLAFPLQPDIPAIDLRGVEAAALKLSELPESVQIQTTANLNETSNEGAQEAIEPDPFFEGDLAIKDTSAEPAALIDADQQSEQALGLAPTRAPGRTWLWVALALLLGLAAALQGAIAFRDLLSVQFPEAKQGIETIADAFGLKVSLPRKYDALTIESFELQINDPKDPNTGMPALALPGDSQAYLAQALLRNRADHPVQWPSIELSLTDPSGQLLARRVIAPLEYLGTQDAVSQGFAPRSERTVRFRLALQQINPNGYSAVLFYP